MPGHARRHSAVICAKTAEPIEMLFGLWTRMDRRKHVLHTWKHIGSTWRIQLNRPCVAAMRHCVKLLWLLVVILLTRWEIDRDVLTVVCMCERRRSSSGRAHSTSLRHTAILTSRCWRHGPLGRLSFIHCSCPPPAAQKLQWVSILPFYLILHIR